MNPEGTRDPVSFVCTASLCVDLVPVQVSADAWLADVPAGYILLN